MILYNTVCGEQITSYSWETPNMEYYIVHNGFTPRFRPEVLIKDLVDRAKAEYELPGITLNLTYAGTIYTHRRQKYDGKNTISFFPEVSPAETHFYSENLLKRKEFDMKFNSKIYTTPETLYFTLLHEFGHVFGLDHVPRSVDSIMGKGVIRNPDGTYVQEHKYFTLTKPDIIALYRHEAMFRSTTPYQRQFLNSVLLSILSSYPQSVGLQNCDVSRGASLNTFREEGDNEHEKPILPGSIEEYYDNIRLI